MTRDDPSAATILSVDVGGSKYLVGYVDVGGGVLCSERHEWESREPEAIVGQLARACEALRARHPDLAGREVAGGMTIPGFADPVRGVWVDSDDLAVRDLPVCELLSERLGIAFFGDNDCNACVLAEAYFGGAQGVRDFLYLTVSSGVGGGTMLAGELLYGAHAQSGEIGLTIVERDGRPSRSGNQRGPLEMYACTEGMARTFVESGGPGKVGGREPGGREIADLARSGDAAALRAVELEGRYLGRMIADADALLHPERVVIGGGISLLFDLMEPALSAELARLRDGAASVSATALGYEGALLGAAACGLRGWRGFDAALGLEPEAAQLAGARGPAPDGGGCVLEASLREGHVAGSLSVDGDVVLADGDLGAYLVADGIGDAGVPLDALVPPRGEAGPADVAAFADALGRALAFSCMLLDPGEIRMTGELVGLRDDIEPGVLAAIQRETYWEPGKVPYRMGWR